MLSPTSTVQSGVLFELSEHLVRAGVPWQYASFQRLEVLANVAMVMPVGLLGALSFRRLTWQHWAAYGFVGSLAVELVQGFLLPLRQVSTSDVVANTLGLLAGAAVVRCLLAVRAGLSRWRARSRSRAQR